MRLYHTMTIDTSKQADSEDFSAESRTRLDNMYRGESFTIRNAQKPHQENGESASYREAVSRGQPCYHNGSALSMPAVAEAFEG